ncbi:hypothetical protein UFOVP187_24 [uncultured Caudovirales phage]|uniref:Uncharacterized protein n=1 Tax=uncultured Caudovirales phage TaxID=2100421 RepID=A0A6J7WFQ4_9CAUD|nr:hypothetical protein UFOVP187_24 [uncultured Caudovirales phage]
MKIWKLHRDNKKLIIYLIDCINKHQGIDLTADDITQLYNKEKKDLIDIFVRNVQDAGNPQLDFLEIYY